MTITLKPNPIYDVYEGEYPVKWEQMNPAPILAILKASGKFIDNVRREDYKVETYVSQCKALNIKIGLYHFILPNNITEQAELFVSIWNKLGGADIPPILDVEVDKTYLDSFGIGQKVWSDQIKSWLDYVENALGLRPIIYTNLKYWAFVYSKDSFGNLVPPSWAKEYDLWAAWYPNVPDDFSWIPDSMIPKGFKRCIIWQYFDDGRSNGFIVNDLNIASPEFLEEIQHGSIPTGTINNGGTIMYNYKISPTGDYVNLRPNHDTSSPPIRTISKNSTAYGNDVWGDGVNEYWLHVLEIDGIGVDGWAAAKHLGSNYANITSLTSSNSFSWPDSIISENVFKDANGNIIASYSGMLNKK